MSHYFYQVDCYTGLFLVCRDLGDGESIIVARLESQQLAEALIIGLDAQDVLKRILRNHQNGGIALDANSLDDIEKLVGA